jgi:hypothetical protein
MATKAEVEHGFDTHKYRRFLTRTQLVVIKTEADYDRIDAEIGCLLKKATRALLPKSAPCEHY